MLALRQTVVQWSVKKSTLSAVSALNFAFFFFLPKKEKRRRKKMAMPLSKVSRDRRDSVVIVGVRRGVGQNV